MRRLAPTVWLYAPQWHWYGWRTLIPVYFGSDEHERHTLVLGWTVTGRLVIALSQYGRRTCKEIEAWVNAPDQPWRLCGRCGHRKYGRTLVEQCMCA